MPGERGSATDPRADRGEPRAGLDESSLIARIRQRLPATPDWLVVDIGDDAAVYEPPRNQLEVITTDALVDGVHVDRRFVSPQAIGHRAVAVNLSDLAAMGASPRLLTLSLALPDDFTLADFDGLIDGALALAGRAGARLVGGNLTRTPGPLFVDVTAIGTVHRRRILRRAGARPGDYIFVSGHPGDARAGLASLAEPDAGGSDARPSLTAQYLQPEPRIALGRALAASRAVSAAIDLSDGLGDGLRRLTDAHALGCLVEADRLPISDQARQFWQLRQRDVLAETMAGGDDYELLFTARPKTGRRLAAALKAVPGVTVTRIGSVTRERGCWLVDAQGGRTPIAGGYDHFSR
jgi:thiamine-monophosphate kinase